MPPKIFTTKQQVEFEEQSDSDCEALLYPIIFEYAEDE
jgi:hypothetical protein